VVDAGLLLMADEESARASQSLCMPQFKQALKADLHKRLERSVKQRIGPSFDERVDKAVKEMNKKARTIEAEQRKFLHDAVEKGRSRPTSAPFRPAAEAPNQQAMLQERKSQMKQLEMEYFVQIGTLKEKMDKREPLFSLSEVHAAFDMQKRRQREKRQELAELERTRWEHLKDVESSASKRPLLIEGVQHRVVRAPATQSTPDMSASGQVRPQSAPHSGLASDARILEAMSQRWFQQSDWAEELAGIRERTATRQKLHEIAYPPKGDGHRFARDRLKHASCATLFH